MLKIALATDDLVNISAHRGRAQRYLIYTIVVMGYSFQNPACEQLDQTDFQELIFGPLEHD
jgi:hypothetical protein